MILFGDRRHIRQLIERLGEIAAGDFHKTLPLSSHEPLARLTADMNAVVRFAGAKIESLEKEKVRMEAMLDSMIEGVIAVDKNTRILSINPAMEALFGRRDEDPIGKFFLEAFRNNDMAELINGVLSSGKPSCAEVAISWPVQRIVQISASALLAQHEVAGCLLVIHDVTEIRKLEKIRSDFVANVSHELKTPLTSIQGFIETLLSGALDDKENSARFLRIIQNHAERLNNLINDLLSLAHIESKESVLEISNVDLKEAVDFVAQNFQAPLKEKGIALHVRIKPGCLVRADKERLVEVLINLVDNAVKFNRQAGTVDISTESDQATGVRVVVEDTGIGIPEKDLSRIFERFYRVDKARSRQLGGTGLGLSIVKHIIELHGGTVGVDSTEGLGSRFWFTLPNK